MKNGKTQRIVRALCFFIRAFRRFVAGRTLGLFKGIGQVERLLWNKM